MQVFGTGHTDTHCGTSKWPSQFVHFFGLMMYASFFIEMAEFGHSNSHAPHPVH